MKLDLNVPKLTPNAGQIFSIAKPEFQFYKGKRKGGKGGQLVLVKHWDCGRFDICRGLVMAVMSSQRRHIQECISRLLVYLSILVGPPPTLVDPQPTTIGWGEVRTLGRFAPQTRTVKSRLWKYLPKLTERYQRVKSGCGTTHNKQET